MAMISSTVAASTTTLGWETRSPNQLVTTGSAIVRLLDGPSLHPGKRDTYPGETGVVLIVKFQTYARFGAPQAPKAGESNYQSGGRIGRPGGNRRRGAPTRPGRKYRRP